MQKFDEVDGGNPDGTAKDRIGLTAGTTYLAKYWNDNLFNVFNAVEKAGYSLIDDNLEQLHKAVKGLYVPTFTYNTSAIATQTVNDVVQGSDGAYYEVQSDGVTGDDPVGSVTGDWVKVPFDSGSLIGYNENLVINGNNGINQRGYVSGTPTTAANQFTLDRWNVIVSGQSLVFSTTQNKTTMTAPAGGVEQAISGGSFQTGTFTLSFTGTATCTIDGVPKVSGDTVSLTGGTTSRIRFTNGTFTDVKLALRGTVQERLYNQELDLCKFRYQRLGNVATGTPRIQLYGIAGNAHIISYQLEKEMAFTPTVVKSGTWVATNCSQPVFTADSKTLQHSVTVTATGIFASNPDTVDDYVELIAEII